MLLYVFIIPPGGAASIPLDSVRKKETWLLECAIIIGFIVNQFYSDPAAAAAVGDEQGRPGETEERQGDDAEEDGGLEPEMGLIRSDQAPDVLLRIGG